MRVMARDYNAALMEADRISVEIEKLMQLTDFLGAVRLVEELIEVADLARQLYVRLKMN